MPTHKGVEIKSRKQAVAIMADELIKQGKVSVENTPEKNAKNK